MKFFTKVAGLVAAARLNEEALYAKVHAEIEAGDIRQGLWLKALSDTNGNELQAKSKYAKARVKSLKDEAALTKVILQEQEDAYREKQRQERAFREKQRQERASRGKQGQENVSRERQRQAKAAREKQKANVSPDNGQQKKAQARLLDKTKITGQASEMDAAESFLAQHNYKLKAWGIGWEIREPLGGRVRFTNINEVIEYAMTRMPKHQSSHDAANQEQASDLDKAKSYLAQHNYKLKTWANGWQIKEPLGGKVRLANDDELMGYAADKGYQNPNAEKLGA